MPYKLTGMYRSVFNEDPVEMEILDLIQHENEEQLNIRSKKTILDVINSKEMAYDRKYSLLCMVVHSGNTISMGLHSFYITKLTEVGEKGCKSIWR